MTHAETAAAALKTKRPAEDSSRAATWLKKNTFNAQPQERLATRQNARGVKTERTAIADTFHAVSSPGVSDDQGTQARCGEDGVQLLHLRRRQRAQSGGVFHSAHQKVPQCRQEKERLIVNRDLDRLGELRI